MLEVRLDAWMRELGVRDVERLDASNVKELLDELERRYPRLRLKLRDETGGLRRYVRVFVDGEDAGRGDGTAVPLSGVHTVDILHSIAGG
ncbi:MAG: MoaD/ThiS family protein [Euryarchaeota archaeon]|nr:MoaD/ThiS family protein [Euryarchaeota archaeon]MDE1837889.1 MoaD/ThiS family protein [Euryarchaeota archaeon]MDE1881307.1 MoaD/ThiS family protein [Euryarchaeota archaeon]MDE2046235.1 MoaD/ThiS family protein [Thermoplasmata archaeon]